RIALDAALGSAAGGIAALAVLAFLGTRLAALGSQLLGGLALAAGDWALLVLLPLGFVALATAAARVTVIAALRRAL
ncbi:MAG: permease, partial [Sphingomonas sp.]